MLNFFPYVFQTHDSKEHLAMMERILGPIPTHMIQKTRYALRLKTFIEYMQ